MGGNYYGISLTKISVEIRKSVIFVRVIYYAYSTRPIAENELHMWGQVGSTPFSGPPTDPPHAAVDLDSAIYYWRCSCRDGCKSCTVRAQIYAFKSQNRRHLPVRSYVTTQTKNKTKREISNNPIYHICRNKRPGRLIFRCNKKHFETHQSPSVLCTPPFEKSLFLVGVYFGQYGRSVWTIWTLYTVFNFSIQFSTSL